MSAGYLIGASLLFLIFFAGLPTSEALKCPSGGYCNDPSSLMNKTAPKTVECNDACFMFECKTNGNVMSGWGCKKSLQNVCPDGTDDVISQLTTDIYHSNNNHNFYACLNQECADEMAKGFLPFYSYVTTKVDPLKSLRMAVDKSLIFITNTEACEYDDTRPLYRPTDNTAETSTGHTSNNLFELASADNSTDSATTASAAVLPEAYMILGWIMIGWIAAQFW